MQLVRYNPFRELETLERDMEKLWEHGWGVLPAMTEASAMDFYEENGMLVAEVNLPKFKKEEVKVSAEEGVLEVTAEHKEEEEKTSKRRYYFRESSDRYFRRVTLPAGADTDKTTAKFENGMLRVTIPFTPAKSPKTIAVK